MYDYIDSNLNETMNDLQEYTKLPIETIQKLVLQREPYCYKREFIDTICGFDKIEKPGIYDLCNSKSQNFFYISSMYTIFGNAKHGTYINDTSKIIDKLLLKKQNETISFFEFGGGCGDASLAIWKKYKTPQISIYYNEISATQKDFFKFRCNKYNYTPSRPTIIDNWFFDTKQNVKFDFVMALDVFEHIKDYNKYIQIICDSINSGGYLWEGSYFLENYSHDPLHCIEDKYNLNGIIKMCGMSLQQEPKMSEGKLWKKD